MLQLSGLCMAFAFAGTCPQGTQQARRLRRGLEAVLDASTEVLTTWPPPAPQAVGAPETPAVNLCEPVGRCRCGETQFEEVAGTCRQLACHCLAAAAEGYAAQRAAGQAAVPAGVLGTVLLLSVTLSKLAWAGDAGADSAALASCLEMTAGWGEGVKPRRCVLLLGSGACMGRPRLLPVLR